MKFNEISKIKIQYSYSPYFENKQGNWNAGWFKEEAPVEQLIEHIKQGYAWSHGVLIDDTHPRKPSAKNISHAEMIGIDIDNSINGKKTTIQEGYLSWHDAINDPLFRQEGLFGYTSPSHTDKWHKFRLVFKLSESVDGDEFTKVAAELINYYYADVSCKNIDRVWFGNNNPEALWA